MTHTGRAAITRGAGRPNSSAALVMVGMVWAASVTGPVHQVKVPSAIAAVTRNICSPSAATTTLKPSDPCALIPACTRYISPSKLAISLRDNGISTLRYSRR